MKRRLIALGMVFGLCVVAQAQDPATNDSGPVLLQEIRQMRVALEQIAADVAKLRENESGQPALAATWTDSGSFRGQGPDIRKLAKIKLPNLADPDQVKKYILDILDASQGQNSWSDRDPQVAMLTRLGSENVPALVEALSLAGNMTSYHLEHAITVLADDSSKPLILAALPIHHDLVDVVVQRGWEQEAKPTLLTELENPGQHLPTAWITAIVNLNDPATYPLLRDYFINGPNRYWTYKEIKNLPIDDLPGAMAEAWERSKYDDGCNRQYMAIAALPFGHVDALAALIDLLTSGESGNQWMSREIRPAILQVIDFRGSNAELAKWFAEHGENLRFDAETKKYMVDEP
jgi:hypothetical protein